MALNVSILENVHESGGKTTAACPACREQGSDKSGDHLYIMPDGRYGCAAHPKDADHRKRIFALSGIPPESKQAKDRKRIAAVYSYTDEAGEVLFQVVRYDPKDFRQRKPDGKNGWSWSVKGVRRVLYHLGEVNAANRRGTPVLICEGEKDVDTARRLGFAATCGAGGAGKWVPDYAETLRGADVVILPDQDDPGRNHGDLVAASLDGLASRVRVLNLDKKDLCAWTESRAGKPLAAIRDELQRMIDAAAADYESAAPDWMDEGMTAAALGGLNIPPIHYLIENTLPEGLNLLAGRPKIGKSWMALDLALAVAYGGRAIGAIPVQEAAVLYLALEDGPRRMKDRLQIVSGGEPLPDGLACFFDWPKMDEGGLSRLDEYLRRNHACRFVIVDTLQKVKGRPGFNSNAYESDYAALSGLQRLALDRRACILLVHHLRKSGGDDILDSVSGSVGITGAADAVLILERGRGDADAVLHVTGRDVTESRLALRFDGGRWTLLGDAEEHSISDTRRKILDVLQSGPMPPKEISEATEIQLGTVRVTLSRMADAQQVARAEDGKYTACNAVTPVTLAPKVASINNLKHNTPAAHTVTPPAQSVTALQALQRNTVTHITPPYVWEAEV